MTTEVSEGFRGMLREAKALPWIGGLCYMCQVTLLGARERWKTIREFTTLDQGTKDVVVWAYPVCGTQ